MKHSRSFYYRMGLIALAAITAPFFHAEMQAEFSTGGSPWNFILVAIGFGTLGVPLVLSLQAVNPLSADLWLTPSWEGSLGDFRQPILSIHLGAWMLVFEGIFVRAYEFLVGAHDLVWLFFLCFGIGFVLGVHLSLRLFRRKFVSVDNSARPV